MTPLTPQGLEGFWGIGHDKGLEIFTGQGDEFPYSLDGHGTPGVQETVMAHLHEPLGKNMLQEASHEGHGVKGTLPLTV